MNYRYAGLFASLACIAFAKASSLVIQPRFTTSYRFTATEVWNVDLQFSGQKPAQIYLEAKITSSASGNKTVASLTSVNFRLNPGVQSYSATTMGTARLEYLSREIADIESLTGSFPAGNYKVCYWAHCISPDCDGNGADAVYNETPECFELVVEPPTPLLLAFPEDKSEIEMKRPTFSWIPPMPIASVQNFNYLYTLVEKRKGQGCPDAILTNRPLYKQNGVEMPTLPYPPEINDLDTGKTYCWKVDGLVGDIPVAQSEVWEFKVKGPKREIFKTLAIRPQYSLAAFGLGSYEAKMNDTLQVVFDQEYQFKERSAWKINIHSEGGNYSKDISDVILNPKYQGLSNIVFVPSDLSGLQKGISYIIEIVSEKHEVYYARIIFSK